MYHKDFEEEIERLRLRKIELTNKINLTVDFKEREILEREIESIENQMKILEKMKNK